jgi:hypothetical protein
MSGGPILKKYSPSVWGVIGIHAAGQKKKEKNSNEKEGEKNDSLIGSYFN